MKQNILVVEENLSIRYLLSTILRKDFKAFIHSDCYDAVRDLKRGNINLVIIDIDSLESKNYDFLIHMHFSGFYSNIPVIVISNNDTNEFRLACSELGIEAFYLKPFDPLSLLSAIKDILELSENVIQVKMKKSSSS
jgi:two-component system chemotaxis response regulator CheY